jgi:soluble lytic murein transglycosylase-like protein
MKILTISVSVFLLGIQILATVLIVQPVVPLKAQNKLQAASIKVGLGDPGDKVLKAVSMASKQTGLSESFLLSLMYSESSFDPKAISSKHYQGLMQIPPSNNHLHQEEDVNTLIGAKILLRKLDATKGNIRSAIVLYKGWPIDHPEGKRQADKVMRLARLLKKEA